MINDSYLLELTLEHALLLRLRGCSTMFFAYDYMASSQIIKPPWH